jgi:hypothetical protein
VALLLFIIVFEVAPGEGSLCQATAVALQYFFLCSMAWMVMQAANLYAVTVIVLGLNMELRLKIYHLFAWGAPAVITGITVAVAGIGSYGNTSFCWINSRSALIAGFLAPLAVMVTANIVGFCFVFASIHRTRKRRQQRRSDQNLELDHEEKIRELKAAVSLFFLLGVSWVFGALIDTGDGDSSLAFQYIFAITVTLQGFVIFIFHCLANPYAMDEYRNSFSGSNSSGRKSFSNVKSSSSSSNENRMQKESSSANLLAPLGSGLPLSNTAATSGSSQSSRRPRTSGKEWVRTDSFVFTPSSHTEESRTTPHGSFDLGAHPAMIELDLMES